MRITKIVSGLVVGSLLLVLGMFAGCGSSPDEECKKIPDMPCGDKTLSACCSDSGCSYKSSDGNSWKCAGTDCTSAAAEATTWCAAQ